MLEHLLIRTGGGGGGGHHLTSPVLPGVSVCAQLTMQCAAETPAEIQDWQQATLMGFCADHIAAVTLRGSR